MNDIHTFLESITHFPLSSGLSPPFFPPFRWLTVVIDSCNGQRVKDRQFE